MVYNYLADYIKNVLRFSNFESQDLHNDNKWKFDIKWQFWDAFTCYLLCVYIFSRNISSL